MLLKENIERKIAEIVIKAKIAKIVITVLEHFDFRQEEPSATTMDISTGHMVTNLKMVTSVSMIMEDTIIMIPIQVLSYMEDHLKNKQRLEQEWVGLCAYEAEPNSTAIAFKVMLLMMVLFMIMIMTMFQVENKKKNRYPDKLPYDHNRVLLNALANGTNSDYINASTVVRAR